jgi:hypothetical protein
MAPAEGKHRFPRFWRKKTGSDTTAHKPKRSSRSPPLAPVPEIDVLTSNQNPGHGQSIHSRQVPPIAPKTSSNLEASQPLQEQDGQVLTLWEAAAGMLDPKDQEKLGDLIQSERGQAIEPIAEGQGLSSPAARVQFVLSSATIIIDKDENATWKPVSSIRSRVYTRRMLSIDSSSSMRYSRGPWPFRNSATLR